MQIPLLNLALSAIPVLLLIGIYAHWRLPLLTSLHALMRMLFQLLLIGYLLVYLFSSENMWMILLILFFMVLVSSHIALRTIPHHRRALFRYAFASIGLAGGAVLALVVVGVLQASPWYDPRIIVPLGGMIFANALTNISLAAERMESELQRGVDFITARNTAFNAAMIPIVNSLFAVGLVALPGMMTGQILSGVSPLVAVRYQIMVMCMVFASSGLATALFLIWTRSVFISMREN
ncbi:MAG: ABC transporter permease [gamma proteobacterium symbiont of Bathyaustriella thionipta]|nr:ABC transporter permease [gamma proteobacterium symbiont of Bathyaustriella thionipta]